MRLYDYIDLLKDEWICIIGNDRLCHEIATKDVKEYYDNDKILEIESGIAPSRDGDILTYIEIDGSYT